VLTSILGEFIILETHRGLIIQSTIKRCECRWLFCICKH